MHSDEDAEHTAETPLAHGFHYRDGWMFLRLNDGSVRISRIENWKTEEGYTALVIDQNGWSSIVASVSRDGEDNGRYYEALAFHGEETE